MGLIKEILSADFVKSGQQPTFKKNFEFAIINPLPNGTLELSYFNHADLWNVDYERNNGKLVINQGAALAVLSPFITKERLPEFGIPTVQMYATNQISRLDLDKKF